MWRRAHLAFGIARSWLESAQLRYSPHCATTITILLFSTLLQEEYSWEELNDTDSNDDSSAPGDEGGTGLSEGQGAIEHGTQNQHNVLCKADKDTGDRLSIAGWSQFASSARQVLQYMEGATAEIQSTLRLVPSSMRERIESHACASADGARGVESLRESVDKAHVSVSTVWSEADERSTSPIAVRGDVQTNENEAAIATECTGSGYNSPTNPRMAEVEGGCEPPDDSDITSGGALSIKTPPTLQPVNCVDTCTGEQMNAARFDGNTRSHRTPSGTSSLGSPFREICTEHVSSSCGDGVAPKVPGISEDAASSTKLASLAGASLFSIPKLSMLVSPVETLSESLTQQKGSLLQEDERQAPDLKEIRPEPELPCMMRSFNMDCCLSRQKDALRVQQLTELCECTQGRGSGSAGAAFLEDEIISSTREARIEERIEREKKHMLEARRQRRDNELKRWAKETHLGCPQDVISLIPCEASAP